MQMKVGFIGAGNMGGALIKGLSGKTSEYALCAYDINEEVTNRLKRQYPVEIKGSIQELVESCQVIIAAIKPAYMESVLRDCAGCLSPSTLFITVAAGIPIRFYEKILGTDKKIVRTMPNTPAFIGEGMTIISFNQNVGMREKTLAKSIFSCVGKVEELDESMMNAVIALTSSSPAYVYMFIEAMSDAAVQSGIPRALSYRLAAQAVLGSAGMVLETGKHPGELKDMVCSPGGTTIEAVAALERKGFRDAVIHAMGECTRRAGEIAGESDR